MSCLLSELPLRSHLYEIRESPKVISQGSFCGLRLSEFAHPSFVLMEGWHFGIWRHIWEPWARARSGCLGIHVDPPLKLSSYSHLWSQRLGVQACPNTYWLWDLVQYSEVIWAGSSADTDSAQHWAWCLVGAQTVVVHFPSTHWQILILFHKQLSAGGFDIFYSGFTSYKQKVLLPHFRKHTP